MSQVLVPILPVHLLYHSTGHRHIGTNPISQTLVPAIAVHLLYHRSWFLSYRYFLLDPALQIYPLYHTYWSLSFRYIPNITSTGPRSTGTSTNTTVLDPVLPIHPLHLKHWSLSYQYIPFITVIAMFYPFIPYITVLDLFYRCITVISSTCPVLPVHPLYQKYWTCATGTPSMSQVLDPAIPVHPLYHKYWSLSYWYIPCPLYARTCDEIFYYQLDNIFGFKRHTPALENDIFSFYFMS